MNIRIEFDGGTSCNVPSRGFGDGYGSYRIDQERPVRLQFYKAMSANAAEVLTLVKAVQEAKQKGATSLLIVGDSQIALGWAGNTYRKMSKKATPEFRESVAALRKVLGQFGNAIETRWQPRLKSVATFGH